MRVDYDFGGPVSVTHTVSGSGTFSGIVLGGRPTATSGTSNAAVVFSSKSYGTEDNGVVCNIVARPSNLSIVVEWDNSARTLTVWPVTDATSTITSLASEVAAAVSAYQGKKLLGVGVIWNPITADYGGSGASAVVAGTVTLAGGIDPTITDNSMYRLVPATNGSGGTIFLRQRVPLVMKSFVAKLGSSVAWTLSIVTLNGGWRELTTETVQIAGTTGTDIVYTTPLILLPNQGLKLVAATTGMLRMTVQRAPLLPNPT